MQKVEIVLLSIIGLIAVATAKPQGLGDLITFKNGQIGVNFGGYHAEAGLGGLLSGGRTTGGLSASAGTPSGANAQAGLGGLLDGNGYTGGRLHASAGLGQGNPSAAAGLGGQVTGQGVQGRLFAGATAGGAGAAVSKTGVTSYGVAQPSIVEKNVQTQVYQSAPSVQYEKNINAQVSQAVPSIGSRTVETQVYQSVPSFTKTIQTETLVPARPDIVKVEHIEKVKTRITPKKQKTRVSTVVKSRVQPSLRSRVIVQKSIQPSANWNFQNYVRTETNPAQQIYYSNPAPAPAVASASASASASIGGNTGFSGGAFGGGYAGGYGGAGNYQNGFYTQPQQNSQLFDDIFNIPISTLTAVNQLLRNKGK